MVASRRESPFTRVERVGGYLPIADHGLVGDGSTAALVARDGGIDWLCVPDFDAPPLFCRILDARRGGTFHVAPEDLREARQRYEPDTGVLVTELKAADGIVEVTDLLALRGGVDLAEDVAAGRGELVRRVRVLEGGTHLRVRCEPRGGADAERRGHGLRIRVRRQPLLDLQLDSSLPLEGLDTVVDLREGAVLELVLRWGRAPHRYRARSAETLVDQTVAGWRSWARCIDFRGPQEPLVRRSLVTLKMLDYVPTGAFVAAPTSSLPEAIGGVRNWDYRYAWVRDVAFSVYALRRTGLDREAGAFLGWVLDALDRYGKPLVLYGLDGERPPSEVIDEELEGYRASHPVRWGNAAADQTQHDAYGEILDCAWQWVSGGGRLEPPLWDRLTGLAEAARARWHQPDHGIWEVRTPGRVFTYSAAMCHVALDRAARIAERLELPGDVEGWRAEAGRVRAAILDESWSDEVGALREHLGSGRCDASLLALPLRGVLPAEHPKMRATVEAIVARLGAGDGLLYRYLPEESPDGLPGDEGAFVLCSFWLVDNLAGQGRVDEAAELFEGLCARANTLGLLPEQIDPSTGDFLGNFPQAFSHVGLVSSGMNLGRALGEHVADRDRPIPGAQE